MTKSILLIAAAFVVAAVHAVSEERNYVGFGLAQNSCELYVGAYDDTPADRERLKDFVGGYFTALNRWLTDTRIGVDIANGMGIKGLSLWVYNYCSEHPLQPIAFALEQLAYELLSETQAE